MLIMGNLVYLCVHVYMSMSGNEFAVHRLDNDFKELTEHHSIFKASIQFYVVVFFKCTEVSAQKSSQRILFFGLDVGKMWE